MGYSKKWAKSKIAVVMLVFLPILFYLFHLSIGAYRRNGEMIASFSPYNFTDEQITDIYVNETWAGNIMGHSGGGSGICCAIVPKTWRPEIFVTVRWTKDSGKSWITRKVMIPKYIESASLQLIFLKENKVDVYLRDVWPCSKGHPMPKTICKNDGTSS